MIKTFIFSLLFFIGFTNQNPVYAATSFKKGAGEIVQPVDVSYCGTNTHCLENYWNKIKELNISWIYNWDCADWNGNGRPAWMTGTEIEYVPMIGGGGTEEPRVYAPEELANFTRYARNHPGSSFLLWNEPEFFGTQVNLHASIAASVYDSIRNAIKSGDSTAKLIVGNVASYDRIWWLNDFRTAYKNTHNGNPPVVEGWGGHLYKDGWQYNNSGSKQQWRDDLYKYRTWMTSIGDGDKEFWLTEFGSLSLNSVGRQIMQDQLAWLEEPAQSWITRYAWFEAGPSYDPKWNVYWKGNLFINSVKDMTVDLSILGSLYASSPGSLPNIFDCPNAASNCIYEDAACPSGKIYDRFRKCGEATKCCNPNLTPTPTPTVTPTPSTTPCLRGDLGNLDCNSSGEINAIDLDILLRSWGTPAPTPAAGFHPANLDNQNGVDASDLNILLNNWGV